MPPTAPLRVVLLTPPGRGAVATVRVQGPGAAERVDSLFRAASGHPIAKLSPDRVAFGRFQLGEDICDEVLVHRPQDNVVEIHCHGGPGVVNRLVEALTANGGAQISPEEWLRSNHTSPISAAAQGALAKATTLRTAAILLDQYHGALDRALEKILDQLHRGKVFPATESLERLLTVAPCGCHLVEPWRVVVAGRPNVGKSSLINALLGFRRAIVHDTPGTTRDLLTARTAIDGWPIEFCDTAGLRDAEHILEQKGIALARQRAESASLVLLVFDATRRWSDEDSDACRHFPGAIPVFNKIDLVEPFQSPHPQGHAVSALNGRGVDELSGVITRSLVPTPPRKGEPVPFLPQQQSVLEEGLSITRRGDLPEACRRIANLIR